jgi:molybdopterin-guanine dinucleotide biosynthesis protein A
MTRYIFVVLLFLGVNMLEFGQEMVEIFYTNYKYLRRVSFTEKVVRERPEIYIKIYNNQEIRSLWEILNKPNRRVDNFMLDHVDIVVDFIYGDGIIETYIINDRNFYRKGTSIRYRTPRIILKKYTFY